MYALVTTDMCGKSCSFAGVALVMDQGEVEMYFFDDCTFAIALARFPLMESL